MLKPDLEQVGVFLDISASAFKREG